MSMKFAGNVVLDNAREIVTWPSSSGCRKTSSVRRLNSGSSSRNRTPLWEREISPGAGVEPPPTSPASLIVWCGAEGPRRQQRLPRPQPAHGAVDPRRFDRFDGREVGQDRRHPLREHRLAGAGRAEHEDVVGPGGGDDRRPLRHLLPAHVGKIDLVGGEFAEEVAEAGRGRLDGNLAGEEADGLGEAGDGNDLDALDDGGLGGAFGGHEQSAKVLLIGRRHGHRQGALGRPRRAIQRQLADHGVAVEQLGGRLAAAQEDAQGDGQVEGRGVLGHVGGGATSNQ